MRLSIVKWLSISAFALASIVGQASAQSNPGVGAVFMTAPFLAGTGEQVLLCTANVTGLTVSTAPSSPTAADPPGGGVSLSVTLSLLNGVTGAVLALQQVILPPLGTNAFPPNPCLQVAPAPTTFAPVSSSFIGVVMLNPQPLPPGLCANKSILGQFPPNPCSHVLTTSLQIYTPGANGIPTNVRVIGFEPPNPCFEAVGAASCKSVISAPSSAQTAQ
jgi:hypothetical protein